MKKELCTELLFCERSARWLYLMIPSRRINASIVGSLPLKRLYRIMGFSVPPRFKILSRNDVAVTGSKMPLALNTENASASRTSAHL